MKRLAVILFILLSVSFVALYVVLPLLDTKQVVAQMDNVNRTAEEETEHEIKKDFKEKFHSLYNNNFLPNCLTITLNSSYYLAPLLPGFKNQPYIPPDFV
jgi:hypothetical protein